MAEPNKGRGCFFYGCLSVVAIVLVAIVAGVVGVRIAYTKGVERFTTTNSVAVAPVKLSTNQGEPVLKRLNDFTTDVKSGKAVEPIELTGDELDYVVRNSESGSKLRNSMHLMITNDQLRAQISLPLDMIGWEKLKGRYFNGDATFDARVENGVLTVDVKSAEMNGQALPAEVTAGMKNINWQPQPHEASADLFRNLEKVEIKDGKMILVPKAKAEVAPAAAPTTP